MTTDILNLSGITQDAEQARLRDLYALKILDTEAEDRFDRYTRLVAAVFDVNYCFVTFLDGHRQWMKSAHGWERTELARSESFCTHSMDTELLEVPDALVDPAYQDKAIVQGEMHVRFYAGAAIRSSSGEILGRLCILDRAPRRLSHTEKERLSAFARLVEQEVHFDERLSEAKRELADAALHDPVTGLPGELVAEEHLAELVDKSHQENRPLAVLTLDFVRFGEVLSSYGPEAFDNTARLFVERVREQLPHRGFVARTALNRLLVVADGFSRDEEARDWCRNFHEALRKPFCVGEGLRTPSIAAGISLMPQDAHSASELINHATAAAFSLNENGLCFFSGAENSYVQQHDYLKARLTEALENEAIELAFQPIYRIDDEGVDSCEALARWKDVQMGRVSPAQFIPMAEADPQLSRKLTRQVLFKACRAARIWNEGREQPVAVNVNISGPEFHQDDFIALVESILADAGLPPEQLVLELTEETVVDDLQSVAQTVQRLATLGIHCALDDFGTGYSSLSYLRSIPFQTLKIDRSFVNDIADDPVSLELGRGIVNIGKALGMKVVAEGVETEAQREQLRSIGCDRLQGFLLARPVPHTQISL